MERRPPSALEVFCRFPGLRGVRREKLILQRLVYRMGLGGPVDERGYFVNHPSRPAVPNFSQRQFFAPRKANGSEWRIRATSLIRSAFWGWRKSWELRATDSSIPRTFCFMAASRISFGWLTRPYSRRMFR